MSSLPISTSEESIALPQARALRVLVSECWGLTLKVKSGELDGHSITANVRASDWGLRGFAKKWYHIRCALDVLKQARNFDVLVLCTVGLEAFIVGRLHRLICPRTTVVVADLLMPRDGKVMNFCRGWLSGIDRFICIRKGDITSLNRRFGVPVEKCRFASFPASAELADITPEDHGYIYAAGSAHRDWPTLVAALAQLPYRAILSAPPGAIQVPDEAKDRITVLKMQSPEDGRELMRKARLVVVSMHETDLPAGPLVLLDAMAGGKPVIASRVNGLRDYVRTGETGIAVPPNDSQAMADAIREMMDNDDKRAALAAAGRAEALTRFTLDGFLSAAVQAAAESRRSER